MSDAARYNVLFLCTGNSARSIMAECAMKRFGRDRFDAFSAGSQPAGRVHPRALELLASLGYDTAGLRSKGWDEFARPGAPDLHFVITVCDRARGETCPVWPGQPMTAHWGVDDPAAFIGTDEATRRFFKRVYGELENRVKLLSVLRPEALDRLVLQRRLDEIGRTLPESGQERDS